MEKREAYSRLIALSKLNVVPDYERIRNCTAIVVGVGGIGSVAAEMLARCGIGRLVLFDYDKVEMANMNRMFYTPSQVGMYKVDAAVETIRKICEGDVEVIGINSNICNVDAYKQLIETILTYQSDGNKLLLLCCVDNYAARITINRACLESNQAWFESGVSETAMSGHIQMMQPGLAACFECAPPAIIAIKGDERDIVRPGVCAASLPTTMSIVAGLMVQNCLKYFLGFGHVGGCVAYEAFNDYFPSYEMKPNPDCVSDKCREMQSLVHVVSSQTEALEEAPVSVKHKVNDWGISVIDEPSSLAGSTIMPNPMLNTLSIEQLKTRLKRGNEV
jgi:ubiquitin-like modifier-activating enzyme 5